MPGIMKMDTRNGSQRCWVAVVITSLALAVGCAPDQGERRGETVVQDSLGIAITNNSGAGSWGVEDAWSLRETLRIAPDEAEADRVFEQIVGIDADAAGRIVIVDGGASRVHTFDAEGQSIASFGRTGDGPGEFPWMSLIESSRRVVVDEPGRINVLGGDGRLSVFSWEGEFLDVHMPGAQQEVISGVSGWQRSDAGVTMVKRQAMTMGPPPAVTQSIFRWEDPGTEQRLLDVPVRQPPGPTAQGIPRMEALGAVTAWTLLGEGQVALSESTEYSIRIHDADGSLRRIIRRDLVGQEFSDGDREAYRRSARATMEESGIPDALSDQMTEAIVFPDRWPIVGELLEGPEGTLWVQRIDPDKALQAADWMQALRSQPPGTGWDVFEPEGHFLGTVALPDGFRPVQFRGDDLYGISEDPLGVQSVVRLTLVR